MKKEFLRQNSGISKFTYSSDSLTPVQVLAFNDPNIGSEDTSTLPLTKYFGSPQGAVVARTGWNLGTQSTDVLAYMKIGEMYATGHGHMDAGNFQIYYKGILASESGQYVTFNSNHHKNYTRASVAHNTLAITSAANTNGYQIYCQTVPKNLEQWAAKDENGVGVYQTGEVTGQEFGPNIYSPEYSYIAGDIAYSYDDNVEEAVRSMIFMPLEGEESPAAFVVFDQITTKESGSKKTFMLHTQSEPTIDGNVSVIKNTDFDYNGMLTNQTLLPVNATIETIGGEGKEFWVEAGLNMSGNQIEEGNIPLDKEVSANSAAEYGWGRIEISTTTTQENQTDYFLNVMYVDDADSTATLEQAELIYGKAGTTEQAMIGAKIFDRVAMFHAEKERASETVTFTVPGNETALQGNVAGLKAGTWTVKVNGSEVTDAIASVEGGIIYFTAPAGEYEISYKNSDSDKTFDDTNDEITEPQINLTVNGTYVYSEASAKKVGEEILVPVKAIFAALNTDVVWDETTQTAAFSYVTSNVNVKAGETTAQINGADVELANAPQVDNGDLLVPLSFVEDILGEYGTVVWDENMSQVSITATMVEDVPELTWDIENAIQVVQAIQSGDDGSNSIKNSLDGSLTSYWAFQDEGRGAWGIYDLGEVYTLDEIRMAFNYGERRWYKFDIEVSEDGENYTKIIEGKQSGGQTADFETFDIEPVKARYVRYIGYGNITISSGKEGTWNSLREVVFIGEKAAGSESGGESGGNEEETQQYTVTFVDEDGTTVISTATYDEGATVIVPADPTKAATASHTYEFAGWTPEVATTVTADATYTATYTAKQILYKATWTNGFAVFEAEDTALHATNVVVVTDETNASAGKTLQTNAKRYTADYASPLSSTEEAEFGFEFTAETSGKHYMWVRVATTNSPSSYIWTSKNGDGYVNKISYKFSGTSEPYVAPDNLGSDGLSATSSDYGWKRVELATIEAGETYSVRFLSRFTKTWVDKFIITTDGGFVPESLDKDYNPTDIGGGAGEETQ